MATRKTNPTGPCNPACTKVIKFLTNREVPANVGISVPPYTKIDGYRHINIFVRFDQEAFDEEALSAEVATDEAVVFYCSGVRCPRSAKASEQALGWGYTKVYYFRDGFPAWKQAGYPVE